MPVKKASVKTERVARVAPAAPVKNPAIPPEVADFVKSLPKVLQDAHRRTSRYIASIEGSGVIYFTKARTHVRGWVMLGNVENAKNLAMSIELQPSRLLYVAEEGDGGE